MCINVPQQSTHCPVLCCACVFCPTFQHFPATFPANHCHSPLPTPSPTLPLPWIATRSTVGGSKMAQNSHAMFSSCWCGYVTGCFPTPLPATGRQPLPPTSSGELPLAWASTIQPLLTPSQPHAHSKRR